MNLAASGAFEPGLTLQFLPGCAHCGAPHPQAKGVISDRCIDCGETVAAPGKPRTVKAVLTGVDPLTLVARACFAVARGLNNLAKGAR